MISDERLKFKLKNPDICTGDEIEMARELLALRKTLSEPVGTFIECKAMGYSHFIQTNGGEPLYRYRKP